MILRKIHKDCDPTLVNEYDKVIFDKILDMLLDEYYRISESQLDRIEDIFKIRMCYECLRKRITTFTL